MKKAILIKAIMFSFTLVLFVISTAFAWMAFSVDTKKILLTHGFVEVDAHLYQLIDPDFDGVDINNDYIEIDEPKIFYNVLPGQVYAFKLVVKNKGTIDANLKVELNLDTESDIDLKNAIKITYDNPQVVDRYLENYLLLFDEVLVESRDHDDTYTFYFNFVVTGDLANSFKGKSLIIDNLTITLDQIQD